jgi:hypothetical protein
MSIAAGVTRPRIGAGRRMSGKGWASLEAITCAGRNRMSRHKAREARKARAAHAQSRSANPVDAIDATGFPLDERVRRRAFELFERRGPEHGGHEADWPQAEREILAERAAH